MDKNDLNALGALTGSQRDYLESVKAKAEKVLMSGAASHPDESSQPTVSSPTTTPKPEQSLKIDDGKGGGKGNDDGGKGPGGGVPGSNANESPSSESWNWKQIRTTILMLCTVVTSMMLAYLIIWKTTDKGAQVNKDDQVIEFTKEQTKLLEARAKLAQINGGVFNQSSRMGQENVTIPQPAFQKTVTEGKMFECLPFGSSEEAIKSSYKSSVTHFLVADQSLHLASTHANSSCILVQVGNHITNLKGGGYLLGVPNQNVSGDWFKCGTYYKQDDSEAKCLEFINDHIGQEVYISIRNGGHLTIN